MDRRNPTTTQQQHHHRHQQPWLPSTMDPSEDLPAEVDEPPERKICTEWPAQVHTTSAFSKAEPPMWNRRESLLTRQLHSETEHTDDDEHDVSRAPPRTLSTQSTWSNPSVASTAELTSDDGHSVASPAISPPLLPTSTRTIIPIIEKPLAREPQIMGFEERVTEASLEKSLEAGLGRRRCISFACGNKEQKPPTSQPVQETTPQSPASPPKRKCMLKFVCPTRSNPENKPAARPAAGGKRPVSPPPPERRGSYKSDGTKAHRGSDSTVTHPSPRSVRKSAAVVTTAPAPTTVVAPPLQQRKMSHDSDASTEATRFHEFASSEDEPEEWVQEATCHRSRLTVSDTLQKENIIRKACEEVEEEAVQEEEDEEEEEEEEEEREGLDDDNDDDDEEDDDEDGDGDDDDVDEEESDEGFHTDDEEGFADSDSEGEESDEEWWRPAGLSTAATSVDHLERHTFARRTDATLSSSLGSISSTGHMSPPRTVPPKVHRKRNTNPLPIESRREPHGLPDSTDFVCGTLDEDRPLEQAYLNHLKQKEAAKHKSRPQDIDPTFPTSDPEMDEEDDDDLEDPEESQRETFMHGDLDELDGDNTARRRSTGRPRARSNARLSPPPPARHRSPAPAGLKKKANARSPAPVRRNTARSPPPPSRKLFGASPKRNRSPAPTKTFASPPNTRRSSPTALTNAFDCTPHVLASRPQLTHTASLPRDGFMLGKPSSLRTHDDERSDTAGGEDMGEMKRGAIDIFKGLEKKRQRRKEKLYQKAAAKAAAKGEKIHKVKPGKGAERMREVGLELQRYHGKGSHILSL